MTTLSLDTLYSTVPSETLAGETADRIAIRKLIDAWGHFADRRKPDAQTALVCEDGLVEVYDGEPDGREPMAKHRGRTELRPALEGLSTFSHTTHFNGQSALSIAGDRAKGETYCLAHHLFEENSARKLQIMAIRYYDEFIREEDGWLFAVRRLIIDWSETRSSQP